MAEIGDAPADLRVQIAVVAERQDGVVVRLRQRVAVTAQDDAARVGIEDLPVHLGRMPLQPGEQRGAEVEGEMDVVVDDVDDAPLGVLQPRGAVGAVALGGDALVPVVERRRGVLHLDFLDPGILARRLVEVSVQAHGALRHRPNVGTLTLWVERPGDRASTSRRWSSMAG